VAAIIFLAFVERAVSDWRVLLPLVAELFSFGYTVQKQELAEIKLFPELSVSSIAGTLRWTGS
jgi:hypothetical protein